MPAGLTAMACTVDRRALVRRPLTGPGLVGPAVVRLPVVGPTVEASVIGRRALLTFVGRADAGPTFVAQAIAGLMVIGRTDTGPAFERWVLAGSTVGGRGPGTVVAHAAQTYALRRRAQTGNAGRCCVSGYPPAVCNARRTSTWARCRR